MAHEGGWIHADRQQLKKVLADCDIEWLTLNREVKRINRVRYRKVRAIQS